MNSNLQESAIFRNLQSPGICNLQESAISRNLHISRILQPPGICNLKESAFSGNLQSLGICNLQESAISEAFLTFICTCAYIYYDTFLLARDASVEKLPKRLYKTSTERKHRGPRPCTRGFGRVRGDVEDAILH